MRHQVNYFTRDRDGYMSAFRDLQHLRRDLELIDIEDHEYDCWTADGVRWDLSVVGDTIQVDRRPGTAEPAALRQAIENYATSGGVRFEDVRAGSSREAIQELWSAVVAQRENEKETVIARIWRRLFGSGE
ncbi:MAG TPA: hypothetical protein VL332_07490 [Candidatus Saccharimonadaceae bacterium]|nr:hypothetical protein [Candidatus Saccharimonadaceae bacterium]